MGRAAWWHKKPAPMFLDTKFTHLFFVADFTPALFASQVKRDDDTVRVAKQHTRGAHDN